jgi:DNA excision repair protein ERCC-2
MSSDVPENTDLVPAGPVSVRTLCDFTARSGDLDRRFAPAASALEGIAGHITVARRRGPGYEAEVAVAGTLAGLSVRGRADGFDAAARRVDEVKVVRRIMPGAAPASPARQALHRAQARAYAALLARHRDLPAVEVALVYHELATQRDTVVAEIASREALESELAARCAAYRDWARQQARHRAARDDWLARLRFPHGGWRDGQRRLAAAVHRTVRRGGVLLAQAPTGIGKTVATLYPALLSMPAERVDKLFVLGARTTGRGVVLETLRRLAAAPHGDTAAPLRVLELAGKAHACEQPGRACHGGDCALAAGFHDRLPAARAEAVAAAWMDRPTLRRIALAHAVCPYHLAHELVAWADVVVGDVHHWFDPCGLLHATTQAEGWRVALLVDEAHNLLERTRRMYSAALSLRDLRAALADPALPASARPALARLAAECATVARDHPAPHAVLDRVPARWREALDDATAALGEAFADGPGAGAPTAALLRLRFDLLRLSRLVEDDATHAVLDVTDGSVGAVDDAPATLFDHAAVAEGAAADRVLTWRNIVPAPHLAPRFGRAVATVLFSATLAPPDYHRRLLGLPDDCGWIDIGSPFDHGRLAVRIAGDLSTRRADRTASLGSLARRMLEQVREAPGNYLAFFSSHAYLEMAQGALRALDPSMPVWAQRPAMDEAARADFLARFVDGGCGIGFAVLGGAFAEGVDLPGRRLVGAFVATLGLPPPDAVNECIRRRLQALFGTADGERYAYLVPGVQKVVQAAGRVIRGPEDSGTLWLLDDRWQRPDARRLLPAGWRPLVVRAGKADRDRGLAAAASVPISTSGSVRDEGSRPLETDAR